MSFQTVLDGHKALAYTFKSSVNLWLARGILPQNYPGIWGVTETPPDPLTSVSTENITKGYEGSLDTFSNPPVQKIYSIADESGSIIYPPTSYVLDPTGVQWVVGEPQPPTSSTYTVSYLYSNQNPSIVQELDRILVDSTYFVEENPNGDIEAGGLRWSMSNEITPFVYCLWKYPANAHLDNTIYQLGVYTGVTTLDGNEEGLKTPDQLSDPGKLFMIDNIRPFITSENVRLYVELIISF